MQHCEEEEKNEQNRLSNAAIQYQIRQIGKTMSRMRKYAENTKRFGGLFANEA